MTLAAGLVATAVLARAIHQRAALSDEERFQLEAHLLGQLLESTMERYEERLGRLADFCAQHPDLPSAAWRFRLEVTDPAYNLPAVTALAVGLRAAAESVAGDAQAVSSSGPPPPPRSLPVRLAYARRGFPALTNGTDLAVAVGWRESLADGLSRPRGWVSASPQRIARADGQVEHGFWFVLPLFPPEQRPPLWRRPGEGDEEGGQRRARAYAASATGLLAAFISTDRLMDYAFNRPELAPRLHAALYAAREPAADFLFNPECPTPTRPSHRQLMVQPWYGRRWALEVTSTPRFEADSGRHRAWLVLQAGGGMSLLAAGLVGVSVRARSRQEEMTTEITEARDALAAAETAREKLGHDLHDGAIQSLYAVQLGLTRSAESVRTVSPEASGVMEATRERVDEVIGELRCFLHAGEAKPAATRTPDVGEVLAGMIKRLQPSTTARFELSVAPNVAAVLPPRLAVELAQIARGALANCLRHARADRIRVVLSGDAGRLRLEIADDGVGCDPMRQPPGMGLRSMQARAQEVGGELVFASAPGKGTRVEVTLPLPDPGAARSMPQNSATPPPRHEP